MPAASSAFELQPYNPDLRSVRAVEVMRVGKWNDIEFTLEDLDTMIAAFAERPFSVPLKVGHGEVSGLPAFGWVDRVYRQGDVLLADFRDVPAWIFESVFVRHEYDHVSIEVFFDLKVNGKKYKRVLKAIALLGAETPAVNGLAPLRDAIFAPDVNQYEKQVAFTLKVADPMPTTPSPTPAPVVATPAAPTTPTVDAATFAQMQASMAAQAEQLTKLAEANTSLLATVASLTKQHADTTVDAKLKQVKVPAVVEHFRHLYALAMPAGAAPKVLKFKAADGKETDRSAVDVVDELVAQFNKFAETLTKPSIRPAQTRPGMTPTLATTAAFASAGEELAAKVTAHMAEHKLKSDPDSYTLATRAVLAADTDLAERYQAEYTNGAVN